MNPRWLIAAPMSGSGKTTIARGLMALFARRGWRVQPFKCGPDYIDTKFHAAACGRPSINLDTFMASRSHVRELFERYAREADICIIEGMMGLFDGYDRDRGSSAEVAATLDVPIVLVVDARSAAFSMAALLQGFLHFRPELRFAGVIFNRVGSERHAAMLREVAAEVGIDCLGCLPKSAQLEQGSRYLGLDFSEAAETDELMRLLEEHIDLDKLTQTGLPADRDESAAPSPEGCTPCAHAARAADRQSAGLTLVARNDEAFSFIYEETLEQLRQRGPFRFFDPEEPGDAGVLRLLAAPIGSDEGVALLYLPGGYPEKHVEKLVANEALRNAIRDYAERGGRIVAECGGMMYLCQSIMDDEGEHPMCGVLPYSITARKADRHLSLGYRRFELDGREYRGHEFHYTQFLGPTPPSACQVFNAKGEPVATPVFRHKNVLASYTHLYYS